MLPFDEERLSWALSHANSFEHLCKILHATTGDIRDPAKWGNVNRYLSGVWQEHKRSHATSTVATEITEPYTPPRPRKLLLQRDRQKYMKFAEAVADGLSIDALYEKAQSLPAYNGTSQDVRKLKSYFLSAKGPYEEHKWRASELGALKALRKRSQAKSNNTKN